MNSMYIVHGVIYCLMCFLLCTQLNPDLIHDPDLCVTGLILGCVTAVVYLSLSKSPIEAISASASTMCWSKAFQRPTAL